MLPICWAPLSIALLSIGPSKAFSSTRQNGQELTGSLKKREKDFAFNVEGEGQATLKGIVSAERDRRELKHQPQIILSKSISELGLYCRLR